jgi:hypothetical protein
LAFACLRLPLSLLQSCLAQVRRGKANNGVHKTPGNKQQERQSNKEEMQDQHHQAFVTFQLWNWKSVKILCHVLIHFSQVCAACGNARHPTQSNTNACALMSHLK